MGRSSSLVMIHTTFLCLCIITLSYPPYPYYTIHELLKYHGLPAGLFPINIESYTLDQNDILEVHMAQPCYATYETRVFFDRVIKANLSYGELIGVEGISQLDLFLWLPVKDIIVYDPSSGLILFDIGLAHKQFSFTRFEVPLYCEPAGGMIEEFGTRNGLASA